MNRRDPITTLCGLRLTKSFDQTRRHRQRYEGDCDCRKGNDCAILDKPSWNEICPVVLLQCSKTNVTSGRGKPWIRVVAFGRYSNLSRPRPLSMVSSGLQTPFSSRDTTLSARATAQHRQQADPTKNGQRETERVDVLSLQRLPPTAGARPDRSPLSNRTRIDFSHKPFQELADRPPTEVNRYLLKVVLLSGRSAMVEQEGWLMCSQVE